MATSAKRGRGRPPTFRTPVQARLTPLELAALDAWRREQADRPNRAEAMRRLLALGLERAPRKRPARPKAVTLAARKRQARAR
jgi:hypothetical protein